MACLLGVRAGMTLLGVAAADMPALETDSEPTRRPALLTDLGARFLGLGDPVQVLAAAVAVDQRQSLARPRHPELSASLSSRISTSGTKAAIANQN